MAGNDTVSREGPVAASVDSGWRGRSLDEGSVVRMCGWCQEGYAIASPPNQVFLGTGHTHNQLDPHNAD